MLCTEDVYVSASAAPYSQPATIPTYCSACIDLTGGALDREMYEKYRALPETSMMPTMIWIIMQGVNGSYKKNIPKKN
jgi:hypothetical protein